MKYIYIYILLYSMGMINLLFNYNAEDIQIYMIIKYIHIIICDSIITILFALLQPHYM